MALEGMRESVTKEYGTGSRLKINSKFEPTFNVEGVRIWGKTGTAEAPPYRIDNVTKKKGGRHAWFVVLASSLGKSTPSVVVVVLVEYGGSGGLVAGPIANQALHALAAEGYFQ